MYGYVYKITCLINNKCYVGQKRKNVFDEKYWGSSKNPEYKKDLKEFGKENFKREILCWCESQEELNEKETLFIISENAMIEKGGYNLWLNAKQSEWNNITKEKHHENLMKAINTKEYKEKMKIAHEKAKNRVVSEKTRKLLSNSLKKSEKRKQVMSSIEYKENMSNTIKNSKKHQRWYMDENLKKIRYNDEVNTKISMAISNFNKGKHWYTNNIVNKFCIKCPEGFVPGRSKKVKENISKGRLQKYNNLNKESE